MILGEKERPLSAVFAFTGVVTVGLGCRRPPCPFGESPAVTAPEVGPEFVLSSVTLVPGASGNVEAEGSWGWGESSPQGGHGLGSGTA